MNNIVHFFLKELGPFFIISKGNLFNRSTCIPHDARMSAKEYLMIT